MENDINQMNSDDAYNFLTSIDPKGLEIDKSLEYMARLVDLSYDLRQHDGLKIALKWGEKLHQQELTNRKNALLHYFYSNILAKLRNLPRSNSCNESGCLEDDEKRLGMGTRKNRKADIASSIST